MKEKKRTLFEDGEQIYYPDGADSSYELELELIRDGFYGEDEDDFPSDEGKLVTDLFVISGDIEKLRTAYTEIKNQKKKQEARIHWINPTGKNKLQKDCGVLLIRETENEAFELFLADDISDVKEEWNRKFSGVAGKLAKDCLIILQRHVIDDAGRELTDVRGVIGWCAPDGTIALNSLTGTWKGWVKKIIQGKIADWEEYYNALKAYEYKKTQLWISPDAYVNRQEKVTLVSQKDLVIPALYDCLSEIIEPEEKYMDEIIHNCIDILNKAYLAGEKHKNDTDYYGKTFRIVSYVAPSFRFKGYDEMVGIVSKLLERVGAYVNNRLNKVDYSLELSDHDRGGETEYEGTIRTNLSCVLYRLTTLPRRKCEIVISDTLKEVEFKEKKEALESSTAQEQIDKLAAVCRMILDCCSNSAIKETAVTLRKTETGKAFSEYSTNSELVQIRDKIFDVSDLTCLSNGVSNYIKLLQLTTSQEGKDFDFFSFFWTDLCRIIELKGGYIISEGTKVDRRLYADYACMYENEDNGSWFYYKEYKYYGIRIIGIIPLLLSLLNTPNQLPTKIYAELIAAKEKTVEEGKKAIEQEQQDAQKAYYDAIESGIEKFAKEHADNPIKSLAELKKMYQFGPVLGIAVEYITWRNLEEYIKDHHGMTLAAFLKSKGILK